MELVSVLVQLESCAVCCYLGDNSVMSANPLVLGLLFNSVNGGKLHSFAVSAQNSLAPADISSFQSEAAAVLIGRYWVVSDVTQSCGTTHPLACGAQFPAGDGQTTYCVRQGCFPSKSEVFLRCMFTFAW